MVGANAHATSPLPRQRRRLSRRPRLRRRRLLRPPPRRPPPRPPRRPPPRHRRRQLRRPRLPANVSELDAESTSSSINPQPRDSLQQGGTLRLSVGRSPRTGTPTIPDGNELDFYEVRRADGVLPVADRRRGRRHARTRTSCSSSTASEDSLRSTYTLNPEAVWHSGDPITAADWQAAVERPERPQPRVPGRRHGGLRPDHGGRTGCRRVPGHRHLLRAVPRLRGVCSRRFGPPSRSPIRRRSTPAGSARSTTTGSPVRSRSARTTTPPRFVELVPSDTWWGAAPLLDSIQFTVISPDADAAGLRQQRDRLVRHRSRPQRLRAGVQHAGLGDPRRRRPELASRDAELGSQRWPDPGPGGPPGDPDVARPGRHRCVRPRRHPVAGEAAEQPHLRRELAVLRRQLR